MTEQTEYYYIENGQRRGPLSAEGLRLAGITPDTMVWRAGLADWTRAGDLGEMSKVWEADDSAFGAYAQPQPEPYFAMIAGMRIGPSSPAELIARGLNASTPVWRNGMPDWMPASTQPEIMSALQAAQQPYAAAPGYNQFQQGNIPPQYRQMPRGTYDPGRTNWLPWAIVGTVLGLSSCLGLVFGIIGIVQANKANDLYIAGEATAAEAANSSAKTMTIISLVLDGLAITSSLLISFLGGSFLGGLLS